MTGGIAESEKKVTFLLVVLPKDGADIRAQVKYWGDVLHGVPTQCVRTGKYEAGNDQYCNNVALKINAKTGGINSTIISPVNKVLSTAMIVGADVSHPAPGVLNRPSIASLIASMDDNVSNYTSQIHLQEPRHEIIANLKVMMLNVLGDFYSYHNRHMLPQSIMFYWDGVSEGEFDKVFKEEIQHIKDAVSEAMRRAHSSDKPKLVFIIVGKSESLLIVVGELDPSGV
ncbi:Piwi domain-containing protein [Sparassis latifolia]